MSYAHAMSYAHNMRYSYGMILLNMEYVEMKTKTKVIDLQLRVQAGVDSTKTVEDLVDSVLFSELQDVECLSWWAKMEPSLLAKGPAGVALVALAKR